ncbi:unnamed protein product [Malus baccata var. baccata]
MALRAAVLRHVRVPVQTLNPALTLTGGKWAPPSLRWMSSHSDDHLTKSEVTDRVLSVVKSFPKVDPSTKDLGLDSLDNVEIVIALEEEFKLEIPDLEAVRIDSANLAIEYIYNHPMAS